MSCVVPRCQIYLMGLIIWPQSPTAPHHQLEMMMMMMMWRALVAWIERRGGYVHPHLHLRRHHRRRRDMMIADASVVPPHRGVFASDTIEKGTLLIKIPVELAVQGQSLPEKYSQQQQHASPWLRCIAAYFQMASSSSPSSNDKAPYMASLPESYETLWQWTDEEIDTFLAGTSPLGTAVASSESTSWKIDQAALRKRFRDQIRPYLVHCNISHSY